MILCMDIGKQRVYITTKLYTQYSNSYLQFFQLLWLHSTSDFLLQHLHNCGWLRPCTLGYISLLVQRKVTERKHARSRRRLPALLAGIGARLTRRALKQRASGSIKSLANTPIPAAMLGGGYGDLKHTSNE